MRRPVAILVLLIQFCVQLSPRAFAESGSIVLPASGSGSAAAPSAQSGSVFAAPTASSGVVLAPPLATATGSVATSSGTVVGSGSAALPVPPPVAASAPSGPVKIVVSEVMWMGSNLSTSDEWVEIAGFGSGNAVAPRSVSGWTLVTVKAGVETPIAKLPDVALGSGATFVVANAHASSSRLLGEAGFVTTAMSLPNTQLLLRLKNASGTIVDEIDDGVGVPFAGANPSGGGPKASMERVDAWKPGTSASNWKTATLTVGFDDGPPIFGTPGALGPVATQAVLPSATGGPETVPQAPVVPPPVAPPLVRLTEIMANPPGADTDEWIEIGSFHADAVDLAEFSVRNGTTKHALAGTLQPGAYRRIGKIESGLPLANVSGTVELLWRDKLIDAWTYAETAEGVSLGRSQEGAVTPQCVPSPDAANTNAPLDPSIRIQSSGASGGRASFNLEVAVAAGSLAGAACAWAYPDGYANGSCNPPSHSMTGPVYGDVILTLRDYCGNTVVRTMRMEIAGKPRVDDDAFACTPTAFSGVVVSEVLPNPDGQDDASEWIELQNLTQDERSLCGWSIADDAGDPHRLDRLRLPGGERLLFPRPETGIALNNDRDAVHLYAPESAGGSGAYQIVRYASAPEGRSYARRDDDVFLWTTPTPEGANRFDPVRWPASVDARIVQAMPDPKGKDVDGGEWIELKNETPYPLPLTGWTLATAAAEASLDGVILSPKETKRMPSPVVLGNKDAFVRLRDREGLVVSTLAWESAAEGRSITLPRGDAHLSELSLLSSDDCVSWSAEGSDRDRVHVRIDGISVVNIPECKVFISALSVENKFEYEIYSEFSGSLLAVGGTDVASLLLREGIALVAADDRSPLHAAHLLDEAEARHERRGFWAAEEAGPLIDESRSIEEQRVILAADGLVITAEPPPGVVAPGTRISLASNVPSTIETAVGTGSFEAYAEPIVVDRDMILYIRAASSIQSASGSTYFYNSIQPYYMLKSTYPRLVVSEAYPSPKTGESEWVELWNPTGERVALAGWSIDDVPGAGSRPDPLPFDAVLDPHERRAFSGASVAWNNDGDDVRLIDPNGNVSHALTYGPVKKGMSYAISFLATGRVRDGCITALPTPGAPNSCVDPPAPVRKTSATKRPASRSMPVRYRNVLAGMPQERSIRPLFASLAGNVGSSHETLPTAFVFIGFCLSCALSSILLLRRISPP